MCNLLNLFALVLHKLCILCCRYILVLEELHDHASAHSLFEIILLISVNLYFIFFAHILPP